MLMQDSLGKMTQGNQAVVFWGLSGRRGGGSFCHVIGLLNTVVHCILHQTLDFVYVNSTKHKKGLRVLCNRRKSVVSEAIVFSFRWKCQNSYVCQHFAR